MSYLQGLFPSTTIEKPVVSFVIIWFLPSNRSLHFNEIQRLDAGGFLKHGTIERIVSVINLSLYLSFCYYYLVIIIIMINNSLWSVLHFSVRKIAFSNLKELFRQYFL